MHDKYCANSQNILKHNLAQVASRSKNVAKRREVLARKYDHIFRVEFFFYISYRVTHKGCDFNDDCREFIQSCFNCGLQQVTAGVNIILSLFRDGFELKSTVWALKYTFCVIVNLNKFSVYVYYTSGMRTAFGVLFVAETVL